MLRENKDPAALERGRAGDEKSKPINDSKGSARRQQEIIAATERADDLLCLWRELRRVDHRVHLARLCFDYAELDPDEQNTIAAEVAGLRCLVRAFVQSRGALA